MDFSRRFARALSCAALLLPLHGLDAAAATSCLSADNQGTMDSSCAREKDHDRDVILSFSTVGDSRQDPVSADPTQLPLSAQDAQWLQNTKAWSRIMSEVQGRGSELVQFYTQYAFWRGMVAPLMEGGTYVVPVPGNHETQCKACGSPSTDRSYAYAHVEVLGSGAVQIRAYGFDEHYGDTRLLRLVTLPPR
jgi:hypothetical protein